MEYRKIDMSLYDKLRNLLTETTDLFVSNSLDSDKKIILCVLADRLKHAIQYINNYIELLNKDFNVSYLDEYQFYSYFMACNTIVETITKANEAIGILHGTENLKNFVDDITSFTKKTIDKNYSDKDFFYHIRSLILIHPTKTDRHIPGKEKGEIQYCGDISIREGYICLHIRSNKRGYFEGTVSINNLQNYIIKEYNNVEGIIKFIEDFKGKKVKNINI